MNLSREDIAFMCFEQLPFESYPFHEEAFLSWFSPEQGTLVRAPTDMGKPLIALDRLGKKRYFAAN